MATLSITEFDSSSGANYTPMAAVLPASGKTQSITLPGSSAALAATTTLVRLLASADCVVATRTVAAGDLKLIANVPEYFRVTGGAIIAAI